MPTLRQVMLLAIAGAVGTLARYGVVLLVGRSVSMRFPLGTFVVNLVGCFLFGLVWALASERAKLSADTKLIVLVGFMGAFTTFSSFAFEVVDLWRGGFPMTAIGYIAASNVVGILMVVVGMQTAKAW